MSGGMIGGGGGVPEDLLDTKGQVHGFSTVNAAVSVGSDDTQIYADSGNANGISYGSSPKSLMGTTGDILSASSANTLSVISPTTSGHVLTSNGATTLPTFQAVSADSDVVSQILVLANSETIGDYTQPASATCSSAASSGASTTTITGVFGYEHSIYNGGEKRKGIHLEAGAALLGETITGMSMWMKKSGSPTGTLSFQVYATDDSLVATLGTLDVSTLTTSFVEKSSGTVTGSRTLVTGDRVVVEYLGGDASNKVTVEVAATCLYDCGQTAATTYQASDTWHDNATNDYHMSFTYETFTNPCSNAVDDNTATSWLSSTETNPNIYVDMSSSTTTSNLALYPNTGTTETEITIQSSDNASSWTTQRTITWSNLTEGAWNYIRFNLVSARYCRIYGNSGNSVDMQIDEIKVLDGVSDADIRNLHGHISISSSDTSLNNAGT